MFQFAVVYQKIALCFEKDCCVLKMIVVFWKRLLRSGKDCCVLENIVVFWKRLLCSGKDRCVLKWKFSWFCPCGPPYIGDDGSWTENMRKINTFIRRM